MFDLMGIPRNELDEFAIFENLDVNFQYSIKSNPKIKAEINKVYKRTLNNRAKFLLGCYHLNFIWGTEEIIKHENKGSFLVDSLLKYISALFDKIELKLKVNDIHDLERLNFILKLTSITINNAIEYHDVELAFESFYQIENRLELENLFVDSSKRLYKLENLNYDDVIEI